MQLQQVACYWKWFHFNLRIYTLSWSSKPDNKKIYFVTMKKIIKPNSFYRCPVPLCPYWKISSRFAYWHIFSIKFYFILKTVAFKYANQNKKKFPSPIFLFKINSKIIFHTKISSVFFLVLRTFSFSFLIWKNNWKIDNSFIVFCYVFFHSKFDITFSSIHTIITPCNFCIFPQIHNFVSHLFVFNDLPISVISCVPLSPLSVCDIFIDLERSFQVIKKQKQKTKLILFKS